MVRFLEELIELKKELVGNEMTISEMDNELMKKGFITTFNQDITEWLNDGNVVSFYGDGEADKGIQIFFENVIKPKEKEKIGATYITVKRIEKFLL